jgi:hypothetical protein
MYLWLALLLAAQQQDTSNMPNMPGMNHQPSSTAPGEPMEASGTSVNPASSPMNMAHLEAGGWRFTVHGVLFAAEIQQTGPRGAAKFASINWFMGDARHHFAGGAFSVRSMLSLEPATITDRRYPELFQTGETAYGKPIVDGQHPHNFVMELGLEYSRPLGEKTTWELYAAPVGDPALGPVAYPHRVSAEEIPQATLAHHLEDSTHISDDVVTAGITRGIVRVEASGFHGAEPNENRWTIGYGAIDSYSARVTLSPKANWTGQISAGRLTRPEALEPGDQVRTSASATYNRPYLRGNWATSVIWGRAHKTASGDDLNGYTLESVARFTDRNYFTGRIELVDKDELLASGQIFRIGAYTGGYTRDFYFVPGIATGLGANFTAYSTPVALHPYYGERPVAVWIFLRFKLRSAAS